VKTDFTFHHQYPSSIIHHHPSSIIRHPSSIILHPSSSVIRHPSSIILHHPSSIILHHPSSIIHHHPPTIHPSTIADLPLSLRWRIIVVDARKPAPIQHVAHVHTGIRQSH